MSTYQNQDLSDWTHGPLARQQPKLLDHCFKWYGHSQPSFCLQLSHDPREMASWDGSVETSDYMVESPARPPLYQNYSCIDTVSAAFTTI